MEKTVLHLAEENNRSYIIDLLVTKENINVNMEDDINIPKLVKL